MRKRNNQTTAVWQLAVWMTLTMCASVVAWAASDSAVGRLAGSSTAGFGGARDTSSIVVLPEKQVFLIGWVEYNPSSCTLISSGSWAITAAPKYGKTATKIMDGHLANGACPSVVFPFNCLFYTWTSTLATASSDTVSATWSANTVSNPATYQFSLATVTVQKADLLNNQLQVKINGPSGATGSVTVQAQGGNVSYSTSYNKGAVVGSGQYALTLDRPKMARAKYTKIVAKWNASTPPVTSTYTIPAAWNVNGIIENTVYLKVYETACSGKAASGYWLFDASSCTFTATSLKPQFASQTNMNGTGQTASGTLVHGNVASNLCSGKFPKGVTSSNSFYYVSNVTGTCGAVLADGDVAVYPSPKTGTPYSCGDKLLYVATDSGSNADYPKPVEDKCPACGKYSSGTVGHVDNYYDNNSCTATGLPNYWEADMGTGTSQVSAKIAVPEASDAKAATNPEREVYRDSGLTVRTAADETWGLRLVVTIGTESKEITPALFMDKVTSARRYKDRLVVVGGDASLWSHVFVIDARDGTLVDEFLGGEPVASPDGRWMVFDSFYPHMTEGAQTLAMLYDLKKDASGNRPQIDKAEERNPVNAGRRLSPGVAARAANEDEEHETGEPFWSEDSRMLVFTDTVHGETKLVRVIVEPVTGSGVAVSSLNGTSVCAETRGPCSARLQSVRFTHQGLVATFEGVPRKLILQESDFQK